MKARYLIAVAVLGLLASCQTTEPVWFIATPGYVDSRLAAQEEALRGEYGTRIAELEREVESQREIASELSELATVIRDVEASNRELQDLASQVETELAEIPEETIQLIVDVLTRHLEATR